MKRFSNRFGFAALLNILLPGAGHIFWRDYLFGIFVLSIALLAAALFFVCLVIALPTVVKIVLLGLPLVFWLFTFADLRRTMHRRALATSRSPNTATAYLLVALIFQAAAPVAPLNFGLRNRPHGFLASGSSLAPLLRDGDPALAAAFPYFVNVFFLERPIWHKLPSPGDLVRFSGDDGQVRIGVVLGREGERVSVVDGSVTGDGSFSFDKVGGRLRLQGNMPLTAVEPGSILVATLNLGAVDRAYQVPIGRLIGKVYRLF